MKILLLNTYDQGGGAARVALDLLRAYRAAGHDARMLVRHKRTAEPAVSEIDPYAGAAPWAPALAAAERAIARAPRFRGRYRLAGWLRRTALPRRWAAHVRGADDTSYPYTRRLLDAAWRPDAIHLHNVAGGYFDLTAVAELSQRVPVVWTLHDAWALAGHCAYFIDCPRWRTGCGNCPDLRRPPAALRDATAENWRRKQATYQRSRLAVATPSRWLMSCVEQSMLTPWRRQIIPYGVNRQVYRPGGQRQARAELGLPRDATIALFVAYSVRTSNPYKDVQTIGRATQQVAAQRPDAPVVFVSMGHGAQASADPRFHAAGYIADPRRAALYYQAADIVLHAAHADNYPCVVLEALACGTPVIATDVGGVAEEIVGGETGLLTPRGDANRMAESLVRLLDHPDELRRLQRHAAERAHQVPSVEEHAAAYLDWFEELQRAYQESHAWIPL